MASRSVNKVILLGHLGQDAETRFTPSGVPVTSFSVATSRRWKDQQTNDWKEETNWSNVVVWQAENLATYLTKGKQVYVEGRLRTHSYDDKDNKKVYRTEVVAFASDVILLGSGAGRADEEGGGARAGGAAAGGGTRGSSVSSGPAKGGAAKPAPAGGDDPYNSMNITDDDVPF